MSKKVEKKYDAEEDQEIRSVAYFKNSSQVILLLVLIILFGFTLFCTLVYIGNYYKNKDELNRSSEIIEINTSKSYATINNGSAISKVLTDEDIAKDKDILLENKAVIEFTTYKDSKEDGTIYFDIRYDIKKNDYEYHVIPTNESDILVRFSYSYDDTNWEHVKNVISVNDSTLSPLMGSFYDIAGITGTLKVSTNNSLTSKPGEAVKMYWKCETFILNKKDNIGKEINSEFKIEYKNND